MTSAEWQQWLSTETEQFLGEYRINPYRFIADKAGERTASRDYHGREVLELLQNGNDAAAEAGKSAEILIRLSPEGLVVANTGKPFTKEGIRSLMLAHLSAKPREGRLIGNKGLGFRSVINWSNRPIIFSGELGIGFAPEFAQRRDLDSIRSALPQEKRRDAEPPVLQFPAFLGDFGEDMPENWMGIYECCQKLRENFDAVIGLPFDRENAFGEAEFQIMQLGPEVLLFVKNISSLKIEIPESQRKEWTIMREGGEAIVTLEDNTSHYWKLWEDEGDIPLELRIEDGPTRYELAFATSDEELPPRRLFSHFETLVDFPYPLVCHASFELDQARNHLIQSPLNQFVLCRLAALHAVVVEKIAAQSKGWAAARLAFAQGGGSVEFFSGGDYQLALTEELRQRAFLPCIDGVFRKSTDAAYVPGASSAWLPQDFKEVVDLDGWTKSEAFVRFLKTPKLTEHQWLEQFEGLDFADHDALAALLIGMSRNGIYSVFSSPPRLLLDGSGDRVQGGRVYIAGSKERPAAPPSWLTLRFLNSNLRERLQSAHSSGVGRDLVAYLKKDGYDVEEYNTASVSYAAVSDARTAISATPEREREIRHELLEFLYRLYQTVKGNDSVFTTIAGLLVPTINGKWSPAAETHFSSRYGEEGQLLEELYGGCLPNALIASPEKFEWEEDKTKLAEFLSWIGVHSKPRTVATTLRWHADNEFLTHVFSSIPDTFYVDSEAKLYTKEEATNERYVECPVVYGLKEILKTASSESILAWVFRDGRWSDWQTSSKANGVFSFRPLRAQNRRKVKHPIPSHSYWMLQRTPWLMGDDGVRHAPTALIHTHDSRVDGILCKPAVIPTALLPESRLMATLLRAGVVQDLTHLPPAAHFEALRRCEKSETKATAYYRYLLTERKQAGDSELYSAERDVFCREGLMWCDHLGAHCLIRVADARYRVGDDIPKGVSQFIPTALLPVKRGAERVEALFGIKPLRQSQFVITDHKIREGSDQMQALVSASIPHILFLRESISQVTKAQRLAIENLRISVCSEVNAQFSAEGMEPRPVSMAANEWVLDDAKGLFVVCADGDDVSVRNEWLITAAVDAMASIFGIGDGSPFARLLQAADEHQRMTILAARLGDATPEVLAQFEQFKGRVPSREEVPVEPAPVHLPPAPVQPPAPPDSAAELPALGDEKGLPDITGNSPVDVVGVDHTPASGPRIPLRVTRSKRISKQSPLRTHNPANGDRAEDVAEAFEREQGRFPIRVGHMVGWKAAGCDILSYETQELADAAKNAANLTPVSTASRLIEVKGRSDGRARITLDGNEFAAANRDAQRYFLYRVFEDEAAGSWQMAILPNPAHAYNAHIETLVVDLEAAAQTEKFIITLAEKGEAAKLTGEAGILVDV